MSTRLLQAFACCLCLSACNDREPAGVERAAEIRIPWASDTVAVSDTLELTANVRDANGAALLKVPVTWTSSDQTIASVITSGRLIGHQPGTVVVTAHVNQLSADAMVYVVLSPVAELHIIPTADTLPLGDTLRLKATLLDAKGRELLDRPIKWTTSDASIVSVDTSGLVTAHNYGSVSITARSEDIASVATLFVQPTQRPAGASCSSPGTLHAGNIGTETWLAKNSPHFLQADVVVLQSLTIEAGTLVCGGPAASLRIGTWYSTPAELNVLGTADEPVTFTASDSGHPWQGITVSVQNSATLVHTRVERAVVGLQVDPAASALVDYGDFRHASIGGWGGSSMPSLILRHTVVDSGNVELDNGVFEDNVIRGGSLRLSHGHVTLNGGRIEDSPGVAFNVGNFGGDGREPTVTVLETLRIVGSRGYPVHMPLSIFRQLWPTLADQDSFTANVNDTLSFWRSASTDDVVIRKGLTWRMTDVLPYVNANSVTIDPGGGLSVQALVMTVGSLTTVGTSGDPITIGTSGPAGDVTLRVTGAAATRMSHVALSNVMLEIGGPTSAVLDHIDSNAPVALASSGSIISDAELHDFAGTTRYVAGAMLGLLANDAKAERVAVRRVSATTNQWVQDSSGSPRLVVLPAAAVAIRGDNVQLTNCRIGDNTADGVSILGGSNALIHDCSLERNGGLGVNNLTTAIADAQRNWWGDPAGPLGPAGDGVSAYVDFANYLTSAPAFPRPMNRR